MRPKEGHAREIFAAHADPGAASGPRLPDDGTESAVEPDPPEGHAGDPDGADAATPTRERELTGNKGTCLLAVWKSGQGPERYAAHDPKEAVMRVPALAILTIATVLAVVPARAQTYDPAYPVCLHVYARGATYYECRYTSLPQCKASASGRAAECVINPYFASAQDPADRRRHRRVY